MGQAANGITQDGADPDVNGVSQTGFTPYGVAPSSLFLERSEVSIFSNIPEICASELVCVKEKHQRLQLEAQTFTHRLHSPFFCQFRHFQRALPPRSPPCCRPLLWLSSVCQGTLIRFIHPLGACSPFWSLFAKNRIIRNAWCSEYIRLVKSFVKAP